MAGTVLDESHSKFGPVFVSGATVDQVLTWDAVIEQLKEAYRRRQGPHSAPPRIMARGEGVWLRSLAAVPAQSKYMGTKVFGLSRKRTVNYVITLFDQDTGIVVGFVDGNYVTARRTAGTSAVAVDRMAKTGPTTIAVLGSGAEARAHIQAISRVRPIESVKVFSPSADRRGEFAKTLSDELGFPITPVDNSEMAVRGASLVIAAARSHNEEPILYADWLRSDALVVSIGSTLPEQREIDISVVQACDLIVCDAIEEVLDTGDMIAAKAAGINFTDKLSPLSDLVSGALDEKNRGATRKMFKSVGTGLQDVVIAGLALELAVEAGRAVTIPMLFDTKQV
jgi:alanine dehydrogenase